MIPTIRVFPSKHPFVSNPDGSKSNIKMMTATFDVNGKPRHFIIPTLVGGVQLSEDDAILLAKKMGLSRYPSAPTLSAAEDWIKKNHGMINEDGYLLKEK